MVKTLKELFDKISNNSDLDNHDVSIVQTEDKLMFIGFSFNNMGQPIIDYSLIIYNDLSCHVWHKNVNITKKCLEVFKGSKVGYSNDIFAVLSFVRSICSKSAIDVNIMKFCVELLEKLDLNDTSQRQKVSFISEQLKLCLVPSHARRYSPSLSACSVLWENTSPSLYKQILSEDVITLPNIRHIHRLASAISIDTGLTDSRVKYLNARISI